MTRFKVGDRVERIKYLNTCKEGKFYVGDQGTIVSFDEYGWPEVLVDGRGFTLSNDESNLKLISTKEEKKMENKYTTTVTKLINAKNSFNTHDGQTGYINTNSDGTVLLNMYNQLNKDDATRLISELNSILPYLK